MGWEGWEGEKGEELGREKGPADVGQREPRHRGSKAGEIQTTDGGFCPQKKQGR